MPAPVSAPIDMGPYLTTYSEFQKNGIQCSVPLGARLRVPQADMRRPALCIETDENFFSVDLLKARQAAPSSVTLRFFTGPDGRTLLGCSYHDSNYHDREIQIEPHADDAYLFICSDTPYLRLNLKGASSSHAWMKTGLLTAGGIALALLAAAAWMRKKGMPGN